MLANQTLITAFLGEGASKRLETVRERAKDIILLDFLSLYPPLSGKGLAAREYNVLDLTL